MSGDKLVVIYDGPDACKKCLGWKRIANDDDGTPWKYWAELPPPSNLGVVIGLVVPIECPRCKGSGQEPSTATDDQVRAAIAVLNAYADHTLSTDLCDELDEALERAWVVYVADLPDDNEAEYYREHGDV